MPSLIEDGRNRPISPRQPSHICASTLGSVPLIDSPLQSVPGSPFVPRLAPFPQMPACSYLGKHLPPCTRNVHSRSRKRLGLGAIGERRTWYRADRPPGKQSNVAFGAFGWLRPLRAPRVIFEARSSRYPQAFPLVPRRMPPYHWSPLPLLTLSSLPYLSHSHVCFSTVSGVFAHEQPSGTPPLTTPLSPGFEPALASFFPSPSSWHLADRARALSSRPSHSHRSTSPSRARRFLQSPLALPTSPSALSAPTPTPSTP